MGLVDRVKNILLTPKTEWDVIAGETTPTASLITGYVLPLAAVAAVAAFIGAVFVGTSLGILGTYRTPLVWGLVTMALQVVMAVVAVFVVGFIINALAPTFGATKNSAQALKVAVYASTAGWIAGIFAILPLLGVLGILGGLYGIYLLYLGLPKLMKSPEDKTIGYTVVVVIATIIVMVVISAIVGIASAPALMGAAAVSGSSGGFDKDSPMGKLEDFGKKMEAAGKKMESAQKSGDAAQSGQAALEALGTMMAGGKRAAPLSSDEVKSFLPATYAGLAKVGSDRVERTDMYSKAEATYGDGQDKTVRVEISDSGGAAGLLGLAAWAGALNTDKEDDSGVERTRKDGSRVVREFASKRGGENEVTVVLASRFVVEVGSTKLDVATLKGGLSGVDLAKLEGLKEKGVASN